MTSRWPACAITRAAATVAVLLTVSVGATAAVIAATPGRSSAAPGEPSPAPTSAGAVTGAPSQGPTPGPSPSASADPAPGQECVADPSRPKAIRWCFSWIMYDTVDLDTAPTRWLTACSKTKTVDEQGACDAVSLTLADPPPDSTPSVLEDGNPDRNAPLVLCNLFTDRATQETANADRWKAKAERCKGVEAFYLARVYIPSELDTIENTVCSKTDVACQVGEAVAAALAAGIRAGIQGLVDLTVQAMAWLLGQLAKFVFSTTSLQTPDDTWYWTYNQIAGVLILLVFVFFLVATISNGLRVNGPGPVATLGGLIRAFLGITFAGGIAWVIVRAWDEATATLIDRNSSRQWDPSAWIKAITALSNGSGTAFLAFLIAVLAVFGLILVFIQLWFRNILALAAGLYGAMAMAGEIKTETRHWSRRWFWTVNALASSKFWTAGFWIYGTRETYQADNLITALQGLTIIWLMVFAPAVLLRITSIWDGYLSDVNAQGMLSAVGHATGIGNMVDRAGSMLGGGGGDGGPGDAASGLMNANSGDIPTTPGQAVGQERNANNEAVDAVKTGDDGGKVGGAVQSPGGGSGDGSGADGGGDAAGQPNAEEADAVQAGTDNARQDLASGSVNPPGGHGGGSIPMAPGGAGGGPGGGDTAGGPGGSGAQTGDGAGGDQGGGQGSGAGGGQGAAGGGAQSAAAGAGDVPIVPV